MRGTISSTGTGADAARITIDGTGGAGLFGENYGVYIQRSSTDVTSVDGDISITDKVVIAGGVINDNLGTDINAGTNSVTLIGTVAPGQSSGILVVNGNFELANNDSLTVEIGGTTPGNTATDHDQIDVTGSVTIGTGITLNMSSFGSFTPLNADFRNG